VEHAYGDGNTVSNNFFTNTVTYSISVGSGANYNLVNDNNGELPFNDSGTGNSFVDNFDRY